MENLLTEYKRFNKIFLRWWMLSILSICIGFITASLDDKNFKLAISIQLFLGIASIAGVMVMTSKKNAIIRKIATILTNTQKDDDVSLRQKLMDLGIEKRDIRSCRIGKPTVSKEKPHKAKETSQKEKPHKERVPISEVTICCPNCGSSYMVKAKSDLMSLFQMLVVFSLIGSLTPITLFAFGGCCVLALISAIVSKFSSFSVKKMKCKSCGRVFEVTTVSKDT